MKVRGQEIWDEFRWEEFMRRQEKKLDKYLELLYSSGKDPNDVRILAEAMGLPHPTELDGGVEGEEADPFSSEVDEELEGELWKRIAGYDGYNDHEAALERLPAFRLASDFAVSVSNFVDSLSPELSEHSSVVEFLALAMLAPARIAGGFEMGTELEVIGGNIANCKRALNASNEGLQVLKQLKTRGIVPEQVYREAMKDAVEVRNTIAAHIVDLREQFRSALS